MSCREKFGERDRDAMACPWEARWVCQAILCPEEESYRQYRVKRAFALGWEGQSWKGTLDYPHRAKQSVGSDYPSVRTYVDDVWRQSLILDITLASIVESLDSLLDTLGPRCKRTGWKRSGTADALELCYPL